jgi:hypothetical protein
MSSNKSLTVVVISLLGGPVLAACLQRLEHILDDIQVLVVLSVTGEDDAVAAWRASHPGVRFLGPWDLPVPLRRQRGVEAAEGELVALLEDTSWPEADWHAAILDGFADPQTAAVGGPVEISSELPARARALGFTEYGRFHPAVLAPTSQGPRPASRLPGNNLAYRRDPLLNVLGESGRGLIEGDVNERLRARGLRLVLHPDMRVTYSGADLHGVRLSTRLQHGRLYGAGRSAGRPWILRLALTAKAAALPIVLSARALRSATRAVPPAKLLGVAFWVCLMESAWALGEAIG